VRRILFIVKHILLKLKQKISKTKKRTNLLAETLTKMGKTRKGILKTEEHKAKLSYANGTAIFVYSSDGKTLINSFPFAYKLENILIVVIRQF